MSIGNLFAQFGQQPSHMEGVDAANRVAIGNQLAQVQMQEKQRAMQQQNQMAQLMQRYQAGDQGALQEISALDPKLGMDLQSHGLDMQKGQLEQQMLIDADRARKAGAILSQYPTKEAFAQSPLAKQGIQWDQLVTSFYRGIPALQHFEQINKGNQYENVTNGNQTKMVPTRDLPQYADRGYHMGEATDGSTGTYSPKIAMVNGVRHNARFNNKDGYEYQTEQGWIPLPSDAPVFNVPSPTGTSQEVGLTDGQAGKQVDDLIRAQENHYVLEGNVFRLKELLQSKGAMRGAVGLAVNIAESFRDQLRQITGQDLELMNDNGGVQERWLAKDISAVSRAALINARVEPRVISLAFMLAQANNPDGRISDNDLRVAQGMINADTGSIPAMLEALDEVTRISANRLGAKKRVLEENGLWSPEKSSFDPEALADDILRDAGLQ